MAANAAPQGGIDPIPPLSIAFAIPGDRHRRTGGFIYESTMLDQLRALGHRVTHLELPASFPDPTPADIARAMEHLCAVPADTVILLDGFIPATIGAAAMAAIPAPVVPIIHHPLGMETGLPPTRAADLLTAEAAALRHATRIVVPSPHTARLLRDTFALTSQPIDIVPPGFDPIQPTPNMTPDMGPDMGPPLILSVGLLAPRKGHDILIAALDQIRDLPWQARIIGDSYDPSYADHLTQQIQTRALGDRITLTGLVSDAQVAQAFDAATLFALATRFEGYGMVFGDAMQRGLPIVTCDTGAVPDTVGPAARLTPVDDPTRFGAALRDLLSTPAAYESLATQSRIRGDSLPKWRDTATLIAQSVRQSQASAQHSGTANRVKTK